ncbi:SRPBCC family protein [Microbacterium esteraromaticum]|uniref:SRPBCC family protein n=1 Tax=Microbacterium esteraromaticum TaxID=57043 RepID=A0A939DT78_9MICO|nr:Clp protease N-terminal domain-containing protein [Microbacterium esteraromaticum]MBN8204496.1 SRPBCC family protein [Microbacterium esteraromaticum]MBN8414650.1 SRPBCC family protein [Microbacterium esteraromaticum]
MNKFVRVAQTSQSLSLSAMEEASRTGHREADLEHLLLALVITDQNAGQALRELGIDIETARRAVQEQHEMQLATLGIETQLPAAGPIVFHETDGYTWSKRATDLLARSSGKGRSGDAAAVLRELVAEPSGLISDILQRLGTTPAEVTSRLDRIDAARRTPSPRPKKKGRATMASETFVPAPVDEVWRFVSDPARVPSWEPSIGEVDTTDHEARVDSVWEGRAPEHRPDGRPTKVRPDFRRRTIELVTAQRPERAVWRFAYPDAANASPVTTTFDLSATTGGTQVTITLSWSRRPGWRRVVGIALRPVQKFVMWIMLFQIGGAVSREFR